MRLSSTLAFIALSLSTGLGALASPLAADQCVAEICPDLAAAASNDVFRRDAAPSPTTSSGAELDGRSLSNAQRLARGLPLLAPHRRNADAARRSNPSPVPQINKRGIIQIKRNDGSLVGYISRTSIASTWNYQHTPNRNEALIVNFGHDPGATSAPDRRITTENSDIAGYPALSLVVGRDTSNSVMQTGSYQYLYVSASTGSTPGATPKPPTEVSNSYSAMTTNMRDSESDVWTINLLTGRITPQWINPDESTPPTNMWLQSVGIYAGPDEAAFFGRYPSATTSITFTFEELPVIQAQ